MERRVQNLWLVCLGTHLGVKLGRRAAKVRAFEVGLIG